MIKSLRSLSRFSLCLILAWGLGPGIAEAAGSGYPDGLNFGCDWQFRSGPNQGLQGESSIRFSLGAGDLTRSGNLLTTYPDGSSRSDAAVLDQPRIAQKEKLWRIRLPQANITCTMQVQRGLLIFDSCSNGIYQSCRQEGSSTQGTGLFNLYFILEEITIRDDHEGGFWNKPEIELYRSKVEPCGTCSCGPLETFCQRISSETSLIFDGGRHPDAAGRQILLPDVNDRGKLYRTNAAMAAYDLFQRQYIVFLVEDDKDKGKLRLNDCIKLLECNTSAEVVGDSSFPFEVKDCPSGTVSRAISCVFGSGDDQFKNPIYLDVSLDPGESTVVWSDDWVIKYRLDYLSEF